LKGEKDVNKELLDLLEKINAKKDGVKNLANEGKYG
jgi:hypothetical protein